MCPWAKMFFLPDSLANCFSSPEATSYLWILSETFCVCKSHFRPEFLSWQNEDMVINYLDNFEL